MEISFTVSDLWIGRVQGFALATALMIGAVLVRQLVFTVAAIVADAVEKLRGSRLAQALPEDDAPMGEPIVVPLVRLADDESDPGCSVFQLEDDDSVYFVYIGEPDES